VHLANTRNLLLNGWRGVLIEAEPNRFASLQKTYKADPQVACVQSLVDDGQNSVGSLLRSAGFSEELDILSIDIDGEDYYVFSGLDVKPRLVCVEVNAGHRPTDGTLLPRHTAARNVGQSLQSFSGAGLRLGYRLICYTGNAFFLRNDLGHIAEIPTLSPETAYQQFLSHLDRRAKRWLYLVNKGWVNPWFEYSNPYLTASNLALTVGDLFRANLTALNRAARTRAGSWFRHFAAGWTGIRT
jgi:hypothetical protein